MLFIRSVVIMEIQRQALDFKVAVLANDDSISHDRVLYSKV